MSVSIPWRVLWAVGTAQALFSFVLSYVFTRTTGLSLWTLQADNSTNAGYILLINLVYWNAFVLVTPVVLQLGHRYRLDRTGWRRALLVHLSSAAVFSLAQILLQSLARTWLQSFVGVPSTLDANFRDAFLRTFDWGIALYWGIVGLQHAVDYYSELRVREVAASQLEARLIEAQLEALQRQLHPHFLFNTLHAISALVHRDPNKADDVIERLSDLLRLAHDRVSQPEVPLEDELDYLRAYLGIELVHFGDRLTVGWAIEAAARDLLVPNLLLQPLAENAVRHGLAPLAAGGRLEIGAHVEGAHLVLRVSDTGRGVAADSAEGVGLGNTRARLHCLYGESATLGVARRPGGGTVTTVRLPRRPAMPPLDAAAGGARLTRLEEEVMA